MSSHRQHPLSAIQKTQRLSRLLYHADKVKAADTLLQSYLPAPLAGHVQVGNIDGKTLILLTDSAALSTKLQFISNEILDYMRNSSGLAMIERIKVRTQFRRERNYPTQKWRSQPLSDQNADLLNSVADSLEDDKLSDALKRIASHTHKA